MLSTTRFTHLAPALLITRNSQTLDTILFSVLLDNLVTGRYLVSLLCSHDDAAEKDRGGAGNSTDVATNVLFTRSNSSLASIVLRCISF